MIPASIAKTSRYLREAGDGGTICTARGALASLGAPLRCDHQRGGFFFSPPRRQSRLSDCPAPTVIGSRRAPYWPVASPFRLWAYPGGEGVSPGSAFSPVADGAGFSEVNVHAYYTPFFFRCQYV